MGDGRIGLIARSDLADLKELKLLELSKNPIKFASGDIFYDLIFLEHLRMDYCHIEKLSEKLFKNQRKLKTLDLEHNELQHLPKNLFTNNLQLENVHLNGNQLQTIDVDFTKLLKIQWVGLHVNVCIDEEYLKADPRCDTVSSVQELQDKINRKCTTIYR